MTWFLNVSHVWSILLYQTARRSQLNLMSIVLSQLCQFRIPMGWVVEPCWNAQVHIPTNGKSTLKLWMVMLWGLENLNHSLNVGSCEKQVLQSFWGPWSHMNGIEWHWRSLLQCVGLWRLLYGSRKPLPEEILQDPWWHGSSVKPWWVCDCASGNRQIWGGERHHKRRQNGIPPYKGVLLLATDQSNRSTLRE